MLQFRFAIVQYLALAWLQEKMWEVMHACVIMHNMIIVIIESERGNPAARDDHPYDQQGLLAVVDHQLPSELC
jgi:hypothetical protein